jgi:hypothetical protein
MRAAHGSKLRWRLVSPVAIGVAWGIGGLVITGALLLALAQLIIAPRAHSDFGAPTVTQHIILLICFGMWFGVWMVCIVLQGIRLVNRERDKIAVEKIDVARLNKGKSPEYASDTPVAERTAESRD